MICPECLNNKFYIEGNIGHCVECGHPREIYIDSKPWKVKQLWEMDNKELTDYVLHLKSLNTALSEALLNLVCCPAFTGKLFESDKQSHVAWTLARAALDKLNK